MSAHRSHLLTAFLLSLAFTANAIGSFAFGGEVQAGTNESSATILPPEIVGAAFVTTDAQRWQEVERFNPFPQSLARAWDTFVLLPRGMSFANNVQPWLSDRVTLALLPSSAERPLPFVLLLGAADRAPLDTFRQTLHTRHPRKPVERTYKGVSFAIWEAAPLEKAPKTGANREVFALDILGQRGTAAVMAVLPGNWLAIADSPRTLEILVDGLGKSSLAAQPQFQRLVQHAGWQRSLLSTYGNYAYLTQQMAGISEMFSDLELPGLRFADLFALLQKFANEFSTFESHVWVTPNGLRSQGIAYYAQPQPISLVPQSRDRLLSYLPSSAYLAISSHSLNRHWQWLVNQSRSPQQPILKFLVKGLRSGFPGVFSWDIDRDFMPWMEGEYAAILFPSNRGFFRSFELDWGAAFLARTENRAAATAAMKQLDRFAGKVGGLSVVPRRFSGRSFTSWELPDAKRQNASQSLFAYGWLDERVLVFTTGIGTLEFLVPKASDTLARSPLFQEAIADMPRDNFGYFFINGRDLVKFALQTIPPELGAIAPPPLKRLMEGMRGVGVVYSSTSTHLQSDVFLGMTPVRPGLTKSKRFK